MIIQFKVNKNNDLIEDYKRLINDCKYTIKELEYEIKREQELIEKYNKYINNLEQGRDINEARNKSI